MFEPGSKKKLIKNAAKCKKCGDIIESTHVHDFKYCKCKQICVDGGLEYLRRGGNLEDIIDLNEYEIRSSIKNQDDLIEALEELQAFCNYFIYLKDFEKENLDDVQKDYKLCNFLSKQDKVFLDLIDNVKRYFITKKTQNTFKDIQEANYSKELFEYLQKIEPKTPDIAYKEDDDL